MWLPPLVVLCIALLSVPAALLEEQGVHRFDRLTDEAAEVRRQNQELRQEIHELDQRVDDLRVQPQAIERVAREKHGLTRTSEVIVQF